MRGHPVRELVIFAFMAVAFWLPMKWMQATPAGSHAGHLSSAPSPEAGIDTFAEIRLSHEAEQIRLFRDGELLFEQENEREDLFDITLPQNGVSIELQVTWPDDVDAPYAELRLEPDGKKDLVFGFWGGPGEQRQRWFVELGPDD